MIFSSAGARLLGLVAFSFVTAGSLLAQPVLADTAAKVGIAAITRNDVLGQSGGAERTLLSGGALFQGDVIRTGKTSSAELMLFDQTNLKIGPSSNVSIDKFVYEPEKATGAVGIGVTKGSMRFVTGAQDPLNYEIKTAVASIGLRGTILNIVATEDALAVVLADGKAIVTGKDGKTSTMEAKGNIVLIGPEGTVDQDQSLTNAVAALVQGSNDPAATAAQILAAIGAVGGAASVQNLQDIAAGIAQAGVGADDLARAVSDYVQGSVDQAAAASDIIGGARYLNDDLKSATGRGLADASSEIGKTDLTAAAAIDVAVEESGDSRLQSSYTQQKDSTRGIYSNGGGDNLLQSQNQNQQQEQRSPN